ncbi:MAG: glycosyltransferase family 2 protein [Phycisphaerales bacterium]|nr:MAG: glycosyltransferase family 2 protein [Phycisphaerales bacterium]
MSEAAASVDDAPVPLSVAIVCKNNETTIGRTLDSVRGLATEIVAVDSGSTDGTIALLEAAGAVVVRSDWLGYVRTKQKAVNHCTQAWVLVVDSDESADEALRASIRAAVSRDDAGVAGYRVNRKVWYFGGYLEHAWQPEWRLRLVRRDRLKCAGVDPHDKLEIVGPGTARVGSLSGTLRHDSFTTIGEHLSKQVGHARVGAMSRHAAGARGSCVRLLFSPCLAMFRQLVLKSAWRDGWRGWLAAASTGVGTLMKHMILIELSRGETRPR